MTLTLLWHIDYWNDLDSFADMNAMGDSMTFGNSPQSRLRDITSRNKVNIKFDEFAGTVSFVQYRKHKWDSKTEDVYFQLNIYF